MKNEVTQSNRLGQLTLPIGLLKTVIKNRLLFTKSRRSNKRDTTKAARKELPLFLQGQGNKNGFRDPRDELGPPSRAGKKTPNVSQTRNAAQSLSPLPQTIGEAFRVEPSTERGDGNLTPATGGGEEPQSQDSCEETVSQFNISVISSGDNMSNSSLNQSPAAPPTRVYESSSRNTGDFRLKPTLHPKSPKPIFDLLGLLIGVFRRYETGDYHSAALEAMQNVNSLGSTKFSYDLDLKYLSVLDIVKF